MRGDALVNNQRIMAEAVFALANRLANSIGILLTPVTFANLPSTPAVGMVACVTDSNINTWGSIIAGGGTFTVQAFYNGTSWTVAAK